MKSIKNFLVLVGLVIVSGCGTTYYSGNRVSGTSYGTTALEASMAAVNFSQAEINQAVADGRISANDAAILLNAQTLAGQKNHNKSVHMRTYRVNSDPGRSGVYERGLEISREIANVGKPRPRPVKTNFE